MSEKRSRRRTIRIAAFAAALAVAWAGSSVEAQHRDRGINQPGAAGNVGGVDPGLNQPGAVGNVGRDPGFNQPGAVGNVGYGGSARQVRAVNDPGFNQPGAVGNVHRDRGFNQPGVVGNR